MDNHIAEHMVKLADEWLVAHRVSETWRLVNMLRDELVRQIDRKGA